MCYLFSFSVRKNGDILAIMDGMQGYYEGKGYSAAVKARTEAHLAGKNPDSHSFISAYYGVNEDDTWKYEMKKVDPIPSTLDEVIESLQYDGGLPEGKLPLSALQSVKSWWQDNWQTIRQNIELTRDELWKGALQVWLDKLFCKVLPYTPEPYMWDQAISAQQALEKFEQALTDTMESVVRKGKSDKKVDYFATSSGGSKATVYYRNNNIYGTKIKGLFATAYIKEYIKEHSIKNEYRYAIYAVPAA